MGSGHGAKGEAERADSLESKRDSGEMLTSSLGSVSGDFGWLKDENGREKQLHFMWRILKKKRKCLGERTSKFCHDLGINFSLTQPQDFLERSKQRSEVLPGPGQTLWSTVAVGCVIITPLHK